MEKTHLSEPPLWTCRSFAVGSAIQGSPCHPRLWSILSSSFAVQTDDGSGRPTGFETKVGATKVDRQAYTYDTLSCLLTVASEDLKATLSYLPGTDTMQSQTVSNASNDTVHQRTLAIDLLGRTTGVVNKAPTGGLGTSLVTVSSVGHEYDAANRRKNASREDGTRWNYGYNTRSEVTSADKKTSGGTLVPGLSYEYEYDGIGNRTSATTYGGAERTYASNALNQYTGITTPQHFWILTNTDLFLPATVYGFSVDSTTTVDNFYGVKIASDTEADGLMNHTAFLNPSYTAVIFDTWLPAANAYPVYDEDGNLLDDKRWEYTWDGENRLVSMRPTWYALYGNAPDVELYFYYDWQGRRIGKKVIDATGTSTFTRYTSFAYDGWNAVAEWELSAPGTLSSLKRTHLWGPDISSSGKASAGTSPNYQSAGGVAGLVSSTYHNTSTKDLFLPGYDANGNIISWTAGNGSLLQRSDYDPFGNPVITDKRGSSSLVAKIPNYGFSTKPADVEFGLLYYGYRYYDPQIGKCPSRDPIHEIGGVNIYNFSKNNQINNFDILGLIDLGIIVGPGIDRKNDDSRKDYPSSKYTHQGVATGVDTQASMAKLVRQGEEAFEKDKEINPEGAKCKLDVKYVASTNKTPLTLDLLRSSLEDMHGACYVYYTGHGAFMKDGQTSTTADGAETGTPLVSEMWKLSPDSSIMEAYGNIHPWSSILKGLNANKKVKTKLEVACCYSGKLPTEGGGFTLFTATPDAGNRSVVGTETIMPLINLVKSICCDKLKAGDLSK